jgi:hypothetical protein
MAESYIASDYAGIQTKTISFYYGYEVTDENDEWCFHAKTKSGKEIKLPFSRLGARDKFDCGECLLAGIALLFEEGQLTTAST